MGVATPARPFTPETPPPKVAEAAKLATLENDGTLVLDLHPGQTKAWESLKRFIFVIAGSQGGKTSFGPFWLWREIQERGPGDYLAVTANYDLFKLKMLPEIRYVFETLFGIGRYWAGERIIEIMDPNTNEFWADRVDDQMYARIILRSAVAGGGLESSTAKAAWLDECGQQEFSILTWKAVRARLSLNQGRCLGTTTPYDLGWIKTEIVDKWELGDPEIDVITFASVINPSFPKNEFDSLRNSMPEWKFKMRYEGLFTKPAGMIYHDFTDDYSENGGHKVRPFQVPLTWPRWGGIDPGGANVAKIWLAQDPISKIFYVYREDFDGGRSTHSHVEEIKTYLAMTGEQVIAWFVGAKNETQQRRDYLAEGLDPVPEPEITDVEAGIDRIIALLKAHQLFFFDNLRGTIGQILTYARVLDEFNEPTDEIKNKSMYHFLDALRYVVAGALTPVPPVTMKQGRIKGR